MKDWNKIFLLTSSTRLISPANARECKLEMLHFLKEKYFSSISKCCTSWKKSISQVFPNVALSERKVFRALAIGRDWIRENIFVPMQSFLTAEAKTFAGNLFRTSNCGGMEPRMAGCRMWTLSLHAREALQGWIFTCLTCFLLHAQQLQ